MSRVVGVWRVSAPHKGQNESSRTRNNSNKKALNMTQLISAIKWTKYMAASIYVCMCAKAFVGEGTLRWWAHIWCIYKLPKLPNGTVMPVMSALSVWRTPVAAPQTPATLQAGRDQRSAEHRTLRSWQDAHQDNVGQLHYVVTFSHIVHTKANLQASALAGFARCELQSKTTIWQRRKDDSQNGRPRMQ